MQHMIEKYMSLPYRDIGNDRLRTHSIKELLVKQGKTGRSFVSQGKYLSARMKKLGLTNDSLAALIREGDDKTIPPERVERWLKNEEAITQEVWPDVKKALKWFRDQAKPLEEASKELAHQLRKAAGQQTEEDIKLDRAVELVRATAAAFIEVYEKTNPHDDAKVLEAALKANKTGIPLVDEILSGFSTLFAAKNEEELMAAVTPVKDPLTNAIESAALVMTTGYWLHHEDPREISDQVIRKGLVDLQAEYREAQNESQVSAQMPAAAVGAANVSISHVERVVNAPKGGRGLGGSKIDTSKD